MNNLRNLFSSTVHSYVFSKMQVFFHAYMLWTYSKRFTLNIR